MLAVHLIPTAAGIYLSFLRLNTFTFAELFRAPWTGLRTTATCFDEQNPLHAGFTNAVHNTVVYTVWTVGLTLVVGMAIAVLLNREFPFKRTVRTLMIAPWVVPSFVVAILWQFMWISDTGSSTRFSSTGCTCWTTSRSGCSPELALGDHHPVGLASAAVRDLDFSCRAASCTR